jgi:lysophospholipase L1-like esterase
VKLSGDGKQRQPKLQQPESDAIESRAIESYATTRVGAITGTSSPVVRSSSKAAKSAFGIGLAVVACGLVVLALVDSLGIGPRSDRISVSPAGALGIPGTLVEVLPSQVGDDPFASEPLAADPIVGDPVDPVFGTPPTPDDVFGDQPIEAAIVTASTVKANNPSPGACGKLRIMPLGDSMTAFAESYRGPLFRALIAKKLNIEFVGSMRWKPEGGGDSKHEGHGGFTIGPAGPLDSEGKPSNLAQNVATWIPAANPDVIMLTIGTNDMAGSPAEQNAAPGKLRDLVGQLQILAPKAVIVLTDVPPTSFYKRGLPPQVALDAMAESLGNATTDDLVLYAPTRNEIERLGFDYVADLSDKTHFTISGGKKMAVAMYPTVVDAIALAERTRAC